MKVPVPKLSSAQIAELKSYAWPGNVRELENVMERAMILAQNGRRLHFGLGRDERKAATKAGSARPKITVRTRNELREEERRNILAALQQTHGKIFGPGGAAELLGMRPTTLASRLRGLGLEKRYVLPDLGND
jgi:DNA-binding NtrC family response regulator